MYNLGERRKAFKHLQDKLQDLWQEKDFEQGNHDVLVVPSFSVDQEIVAKVAGFLHYEERLLFSLIRLRNPNTRLIYITAQPLPTVVIDYYLQLLPSSAFHNARARLILLNADDASFKPLSQKILERPRLISLIKAALRPNKSYMVCYNATQLEEELSLELNIPLLACAPDLLYWGTKSGSRQIFADCQIPHPDGCLQVDNLPNLIKEISALCSRKPHLNKMIIKINEGLSGEGNAVLELKSSQENFNWNERLENLRFQAEGETWKHFATKIEELGGIVEEYIGGEYKRSPSVQGYISPKGEVEIISTHEQVLGGPDGQIYFGCTFPADVAYRQQLQEYGLRVGQALANKGAIEHYGVDFIAVWSEKTLSWNLYAIEINLRKGGTTHPFMTLKLLTSGEYDRHSGLFYSPDGQEKYYISSDNLCKPQYRGLLPSDLMKIIAKYRLHFDNSLLTGTLFHLMGALSEFGKLGLTCIGNSPQQAQEIYQHVEAILDLETQE